ncbi:hypothetical protein BDY24DRAFT_393069, partial [Mrakia frigida]|uniref:uncharacterized protein n=1 Tax=Mrakia frigida TaxID=29902 RepID=UPI003FCC0DF8
VLELWNSTHRWTSLSLDRCLLVRFLVVVFVLPVFLQTSIFCYQNPPSSSSLRSRPLPERDPRRDPSPSPPTLPLVPLLERSPRTRRSSSQIETLQPSRSSTRLSSMEGHRSASLLPTGRVRHSRPGHAETCYRLHRHGPLPSHQEVSASRLGRRRWPWSQRRRGRCGSMQRPVLSLLLTATPLSCTLERDFQKSFWCYGSSPRRRSPRCSPFSGIVSTGRTTRSLIPTTSSPFVFLSTTSPLSSPRFPTNSA